MNLPTLAASAQSVLSVSDLRFGYLERPMWDRLSIDISPGFTWVKGGNGSGKSTLLKLLAGALTPMSGRIAVQGVAQDLQPLQYRRRVFWCGPGSVPFDHLSPLEFFGFMRRLYPSFDLQALATHMAGFGLKPHASSVMRTLSTGTQRKVWLAAALSAQTPVTLLDEPLNALDAVSLDHLRHSLASVNDAPSRLWIVASHDAFGPASTTASVIDMDRTHGADTLCSVYPLRSARGP